MRCKEAQDILLRDTGQEGSEEVAAHLESCPRCRRFAARFRVTHTALHQPMSDVLPDALFASRVVAELPRSPEVLGRAALRLLPATLALAVVLTSWSLLTSPNPTALVEETPADDPVSWVLDLEEPS